MYFFDTEQLGNLGAYQSWLENETVWDAGGKSETLRQIS